MPQVAFNNRSPVPLNRVAPKQPAFRPAGDAAIPANVLRDKDGRPVFDKDGQYVYVS